MVLKEKQSSAENHRPLRDCFFVDNPVERHYKQSYSVHCKELALFQKNKPLTDYKGQTVREHGWISFSNILI